MNLCQRGWKKVVGTAMLAILTCAAGCGTTTLDLRPTDYQVDFSRYKSITVQTSNGRGVAVPESAQARIKGLIRAEILECCQSRFSNVSIGDPGSQDLLVNVKFTIYEEGSKFARFMLAGLGSMQIHGNVEIADAASGQLISGGEAGKTFRWGGVYGAMTGIEDLEKDFAKEVVLGLRKTLGMSPNNN